MYCLENRLGWSALIGQVRIDQTILKKVMEVVSKMSVMIGNAHPESMWNNRKQ